MHGGESTIPKFNLLPTLSKNGKTTMPISLFNYHPTELRVLIIYGNDFGRSHKSAFAKYWAFKSIQLLSVYYFVSVGILCFIRRKLNLRHDGFISSWIDFLISQYGGETLRITHRIEQWCFAPLLIAGIFVQALIGTFMFDAIWLNPRDIILSVDEITAINPPIFLSPTLAENEQTIKAILRFDFHGHFLLILLYLSSF